MSRIICVGQALIDVIVKGHEPGNKLAESSSISPGGEAFNEAVWLSKLGDNAAIYGRIGNDTGGTLLKAKAIHSGVDMSLVGASEETPVTIMFTKEDGSRPSITSTAHNLPGFVPDPSLCDDADVVMLSGLFRAPFKKAEEIIRFARHFMGKPTKVFCDVKMPRDFEVNIEDYYSIFPYIDYISPNYEEAKYLTGLEDPYDMADAFHDMGVGNVMIKLGPDGVMARTSRKHIAMSAYPVEVADMIGCGDAFAAGFVHRLGQGAEFRECLEFATACGALCATARGTVAGAATEEEVEHFMATHSKKPLKK